MLKQAWGYQGWVMSDWGATPEWEFALAGLDQESGVQLDAIVWRAEPLVEPLRQAYAAGASCQGAAVGHGPAHPALDVRRRRRRLG